jgi:hypothetical protein
VQDSARIDELHKDTVRAGHVINRHAIAGTKMPKVGADGRCRGARRGDASLCKWPLVQTIAWSFIRRMWSVDAGQKPRIFDEHKLLIGDAANLGARSGHTPTTPTRDWRCRRRR